ncbi:hypothetical protein ASPTUDRAFT_118102 [Aspergillus tubingensis CBS 134.48]|uniref:Major facilitator superfamily (MFS) profile domain-containing protein n=1 Tax=Aspergillus tubingensis (strain CBS 134.48) TaxID=767770 RepID=A0A1L9N7Y3_ASPTC|nr:hypothetical protein ASPTUDRAFT_118102 [Aspergillus tubingensis CBS 134.48]
MPIFKDRDLDVPGTELLIDVRHDQNVPHDSSDIILLPPPTACEGDPLNWSDFKKYWHLLLVSAYACIFSFAENNTGDAYSTIVDMTGSTMTIMNGGGALNYLMLGLVNIFWIPAAMKIGRRFCFLATLLLCIGSSIWMGAFHTAGEWYGCNIVNGLGTSAYEAVIQLAVFDLFFDHQRGRMLGFYIFAQQLGSIIGLVSGGYIADGPGWRWAQWVVSIGEGILIIIFFFTYEETLFPRFLFNPAQSLPTAEAKLKNPIDATETASLDKKDPATVDNASVNEGSASDTIPAPSEFPKRTFKEKLRLWVYYPQDKTTYWSYFKRPFFLLAFPNIIIAGIIFAFGCTSGIVTNKTISEILTGAPYNFTDGQTGLAYLSALVGSIIGYLTSVMGDKIVIYLARRNDGVKEPEMRLWALTPCFIYSAVGYELYGWGAQEGAHWMTITVGIGAMIAQQVAATSTATAYAMECFPGVGGEIVVILAICSSIINFIISETTQPFYEATGPGWLFLFYGICVIISLAAGMAVYVWGKKWRRKCAPKYYKFLQERGGNI